LNCPAHFLERTKPNEELENLEVQFKDTPPCINAILENGVFELHTINSTMFRLTAFFKSQNISNIDCLRLIKSWIANIKPEHSVVLTSDGQTDIAELEKSAQYVVRTVYGSDNYGFNCGSIRSLIGDRFCNNDCRNITEKKLEVELFNITKAEYLGKRLNVKAEAIGRLDTVMAIPYEVELSCELSGTDKCNGCPLQANNTGLKVYVTARNHNIMNLIEPSNQPLVTKLAYIFNIPQRNACNDWKFKIMSQQNVETIYISPVIANEFSDSDRYIRNTVYFLGHGLKENTSYEFTGYTHISKNNTVKFIVDGIEPMVDSLEHFVLTDEIIEKSKVLSPYPGQTLEEKHNQIIESINYNYIRIWGRNNLIKAVDLTFHSVRYFNFQRKTYPGWMDICIIGDTGQGKSEVVEDLMKCYNLGIRVVGETASRTGLLYTIPVNDKVIPYIIWGIIPRHSGRLVVIDEFQHMVESREFSEFTDVRSKGILNVTRTVSSRAATETRLIWMTNTVGRKAMVNYGYPVKAIMELIPDAADIRRFTFMIGVVSNEVSDEVINTDIESMQAIADSYSAVSHEHLLRIWNLKAEDIIITREVEKRILALSLYMCKEYVATIPLVEPGDFRLKLVRVSCAIAARMNLFMENKLIVTKEAVDYAFKFFNDIYTDDSLKYHQYSALHAEYALSDKEIESLMQTFKVTYPMEYEIVSKKLLLNPYVKTKELAVTLGIDESNIKQIVLWLAGYNFLDTFKGSYVKTPIGVKFLQKVVPQDKIKGIANIDDILGDYADKFNIDDDDF